MNRLKNIWLQMRVTERVKNFWRSDAGQDLVEYALLVALIALVIVAAAPPLRSAIVTLFSNIAAQLAPPASG